MNPIGKDISAWSEILSVNPSLVEWTRTDPLSLSQDIIRTDKVTYPSLASGHNTRNTASIYSEIDKLKELRRGGNFIKIQEGAQEVSFIDVWSVGKGSDVRLVGFVRASASKLLLGTRPNDWAGAVPEKIVGFYQRRLIT